MMEVPTWNQIITLIVIFGSAVIARQLIISKKSVSLIDKVIIKILLHYLENTDYWETYYCTGLCDFVGVLNKETKWAKFPGICKIMLNFINSNFPKNSYGVFWFEPTDKQVRIDYLKKLLNEEVNR